MTAGPRRRQRVRVPWRLVASACYEDVALAVYLKVAALAQRAEGCTAGTRTLAGYLDMSVSSVERGLAQLARPAADDGVVELSSTRRSKPGGDGDTAVRRLRPVGRAERFVWLPVAACEDLTPRQLRAYAVIVYASARHLPLAEAELAQFLRHARGVRAGCPVTAAAAGRVVDALESVGWVTVERRAGGRGRHQFLPHDIPPAERTGLPNIEPVPGASGGAVGAPVDIPAQVGGSGSASPERPAVGDGSGSAVCTGSLTYKEDHLSCSPEDDRALYASAVGEVQVREGVENSPLPGAPRGSQDWFALRADPHPPPPSPVAQTCGSSFADKSEGRYNGPALTLSPRVYHVLEPAHWLLKQATVWEQRRIAREVGRQLRSGTEVARLSDRVRRRLAATVAADIRSPGRWLLGVGLPRWGCAQAECEEGVLWVSGAGCEECRAALAAHGRAGHLARGVCPEHTGAPMSGGVCPDCEADRTADAPLPTTKPPARRVQAWCLTCRHPVVLDPAAPGDRLCVACRDQSHLAAGLPRTGPPVPCQGYGGELCGRTALLGKTRCLRCLSRSEMTVAAPAASRLRACCRGSPGRCGCRPAR